MEAKHNDLAQVPEESKKTLPLVIISLVGIAVLVGVVFTYAGKVSLLYLQADEVFTRLQQPAQKAQLVGSFFRIHGTLKAKTTRRFQGRLDWEFHVQGKKAENSLLVQYHGTLPDTFKDGAELVLEGKLETPTLYRATSIFAKCPTKYKEEKVGLKKTTSS